METQTAAELDFNTEDYNGFYYTCDKQIRKMDDAFIMSKVIEKYPDFAPSSGENFLKQVFMLIAKDTKFVNQLTKKYDITVHDLFSVVYRTYSFIFNQSFITKVQKLVSKRAYAKSANGRGKVSAGA